MTYEVVDVTEYDVATSRWECTATLHLMLPHSSSPVHSATRYGQSQEEARLKAIGACFEGYGRHVRTGAKRVLPSNGWLMRGLAPR